MLGVTTVKVVVDLVLCMQDDLSKQWEKRPVKEVTEKARDVEEGYVEALNKPLFV